MDHGKSEMACIAACAALLDRGWGRPTQPLSGDDAMPPIALSVEERERQVGARIAAAHRIFDETFVEITGEQPGARADADG